MISHMMAPKQQRLFNCANPIEPLNCSQGSNFQTHELADLKHQLKATHTLTESKEKLSSHVMTLNIPKQQRLFSCANPMESFKCSQCTSFQTHKLAELKYHFKADHTLKESKEKLYECANCTLQTYSNFLYLRHKVLNRCLTNRKVTSEEAFSGDENVTDSKVFKSGDFFNNTHRRSKYHIKRCQHLDNFQYDNCSYKTPSKSRLDNHSKKKHKSSKSKFQKCRYCPYTTERTGDLNRHISVKHTDPEKIKWFECENCSFKTKTKHNLKEHIMVKHTDAVEIQWLKCEDCSFKAKTKRILKNHILVKHTDEDDIKWFKCEDCSFKSKTRGSLKEHIMFKHTAANEIRWVHCEDCSFKTTRKWCLKEHIKYRHTDADKIQWFQCEDCSWKSKTNSDLKKHIRGKHRRE